MATIKFNLLGTPFNNECAMGDFYTMLSTIKSCTGRQYNPEDKSWSIAYTLPNLEKLKTIITIDNYTKYKNYIYKIDKELSNLSFLFPFQRDGVREMIIGKNFCYDEVGLGKTIQALAYSQAKQYNQVLIICPAMLKKQWSTEIKKFLSISSTVLLGTIKKRTEQITSYIKNKTKHMIINYEQLRFNPLLLSQDWDLVIFDEVHRIKNSQSKTFQYCKQLNCNDKLGLTATPLVNSPKEFFNLLNFLSPGIVNWQEFSDKFCNYDNIWTGKTYVNAIIGYKNLEELGHISQKIMIRRYKKDVIKELPEKTFKTYRVNITGEQKRVIRYYEHLAKGALNDGAKEVMIGAFTMALMACLSPELIKLSESKLKINVDSIQSSKVNELKNIIQDLGFK